VHSKPKHYLYRILIETDSKSRISRAFNLGMLILIILNVIAVTLSTIESLYEPNKLVFEVFEILSIFIFSIEYIARMWVCTLDKEYSSPVLGRIRFALRPMQMIDLLAILPFFLPFLGVDLRFIRAVRLFRVFRILKLGRYSEALSGLTRVIRTKKEELYITIFAGLILLLLSSSLMYIIENAAQPDKFQSIPDAMWWAVSTLTTVGYGDVYPITPMGKMLGSFIAILGIGLFALPAGIISSGFAAEIQKKHTGVKVCPHCGKPLG
jgi:voltage-gated potassium channel